MKCCGRGEKGEGGRDLSLQPSPRETGARRQSQKGANRERDWERKRDGECPHEHLYMAVHSSIPNSQEVGTPQMSING